MQTALIDGDIVAYMAASLAQEDAFPPLPGQTEADCKPTADLKKAKRIAREIADKWEHIAGCTNRRIAMTDRDTARSSFRYQVHPHYKNQRVKEKPVLLGAVIDWMFKAHDAEYEPRLEGDDLLGIWQTGTKNPDVIISKDKDMMTIPGRTLIIPHMKTTDGLKVKKVSPSEAADHMMMQVITGDAVDNYLGAPGAGMVKAKKMLDLYREGSYSSRWETIVDTFVWAWEYRKTYRSLWVHPGDPEAEALMNMRCARILRAKDYRNSKIGLWMPDGEREWV
jgi:hypothetical protein